MIKRIKLNLRIFKNTFFNTLSALLYVMTAVLLLIPKEEFGINTFKEAIIVYCAAGTVALIYTIVRIYIYNNVKVFNNNRCSLTLRYGDLWKIAFKKKPYFKNTKRIVVVGVNTAFDTIVDKDLSLIEKPLVSEHSIHGQWLNLMKSKGINESILNKSIQKSLQLQGVNSIYTLNRMQKKRGNLECFERGTIAVYEYENTIFYLLAIAEFDENNNAHNTKEELIESIKKLIVFYDQHGQANDIYIPLLGTGMSRTDITPEEALKILSSMFEIYKSKLNGKVNIIVYKNDRSNISLDI